MKMGVIWGCPKVIKMGHLDMSESAKNDIFGKTVKMVILGVPILDPPWITLGTPFSWYRGARAQDMG
jgi:hypothetical protein